LLNFIVRTSLAAHHGFRRTNARHLLPAVASGNDPFRERSTGNDGEEENGKGKEG